MEKLTELEYTKLYKTGNIASWYLRESQLALYQMLLSKKKVVTKCHRRWGKGTTVFVYAFEKALTEKIIIRYGTDTQLHALSIFEYLRDKIFEYAPALRPVKYNGYYLFRETGARLYIFGVKDSSECDKARGEESDIIILDEFGFWKYKPAYMLKSVLQPQLLETNGQMIITSTPPEDLTHEYINQVAQAERDGYLFQWDIQDSLKIGEKTIKDVNRIIDDCGGENSDSFKREYLCQLIATKERLVVPEAQQENLYTTTETVRPPYFDYYICMDLGLHDYTAVLFGYYDFKASRLVVEREFVANYLSTSEIVHRCLELEEELLIKGKVYRRLGDCEMQQLFDMSKDHGYQVSPITKRSKQSSMGFRDSVINGLRMAIQTKRIIINKKHCPSFRQQLKYGIWNERRTDFVRTEAMGHLDALIALAYLWDNIDLSKNPYPHVYKGISEATHFISPTVKKEISDKRKLSKLIGR